jgi:hypothetical protein
MRQTHTWHAAAALKARAEEVGRAEFPLASASSTIDCHSFEITTASYLVSRHLSEVEDWLCSGCL